jgi:hypothetical protein
LEKGSVAVTRHTILILLAALGLAAPACRGAARSAASAAEPPAPLIEPELAPGSRLVDHDERRRAHELRRLIDERTNSSYQKLAR